MSTAPNTEIFLGCGDQQVRVVLIEDAGNLIVQVFATDPDNTDIDGLFFNFADGVDTTGLTIYPGYDESIGSNGENVTGFDASTGSMNQLNNGAQIQDSYDVRLEFGTVPYSSGGDVDEAALTFYIDGGASNLTADSLDLSAMTAVINSDDGVNGMALVGGTGTQGAATTLVEQTLDWDAHELFNSGAQHHYTPDDAAVIESDDHWYIAGNTVSANGCADGVLTLAEVQTDGPVSLDLSGRVIGVQNFENGGWAHDEMRIEVQIDGGEWVTLDTFTVNHDGTALVGDQTGQELGSHVGGLSYSGGILDTAEESAQFRIVADFSAYDEQVEFHEIEVTYSEEVAAEETETETVVEETVVAEETFDSTHNVSASHADSVDGHTRWDMRGGELQTDGCDDGLLAFDTVSVDGPATISFDARAPHTENFENSGCYEDSFQVWAHVDGTEWVHLDTFKVNEDGTALVGDQSGQTIENASQTLSYSGGALDDAETVTLYFYSDISSSNEEIYFDNVTITESVETEVPVEGGGSDDPFCDEYAVTYDDVMVNASQEEEAAAEDETEDEMAGMMI